MAKKQIKSIKGIYKKDETNYSQFPIDVLFIPEAEYDLHIDFLRSECIRISKENLVAVYESYCGIGLMRNIDEDSQDFRVNAHRISKIKKSGVPIMSDVAIQKMNDYVIFEIWKDGKKLVKSDIRIKNETN